MIETGAGICLQVRNWKKLNDSIYFLTYLFSFARGGKCSPIRTHRKVFILLPQSWNFSREKPETVNKSISKKVETFVMFFYLRNGKYVSNFIYSLFLFDFSRSGNYSNNNIFLFYSFFPQTVKSLHKTLS